MTREVIVNSLGNACERESGDHRNRNKDIFGILGV